MGGPGGRVRSVARSQLDRRLDEIRKVSSLLRPPQRGWVRELRKALAMSQADLARRMGVSHQAISQLEKREQDGSITLKALQEAASALESELMYVLVPKQSIQETLERRALRIASEMTGSVRHSMRLEDQEPMSELDDRTRALAAELLESPRQLWSIPDDE